MPLPKQVVPLVIDQGLNTKTDIKQEEPGFLRKAENLVYETIKKLRKRNGYDQLDLYDQDGERITGQRTVSKLASELVLLTDTALYGYAPSLGRFTHKGDIYPARLQSEVVLKNALNQDMVDGLVVDQFKVFCWSDSQGNVRYSVQDMADKSYLVSAALVAVGVRPCLARISNIVYIVFGNGAALKFCSFSIAQPADLSSITTAASDRDLTDGLIDTKSVGMKVMVSYNSATNLKLFAINDGGTTSSIVGVTGENATDALDVGTDSSQRIILMWSDGTDVKYTIYPYILTSPLLAPTVIETIADATNCCSIEESAGVYRFHYEVEQVGVGNNFVKQSTGTAAGVVGTPTVYMRSVGLGARNFRYNDETYTTVVHESPTQATYFTMNSSGKMVTKFANQTASSVLTWGSLPEVSAMSDSSFMIPALFRNRTKASATQVFFSTNGVADASLDFTPSTGYSTAELAESLHIASGCLKLYDGAQLVEDGFHVYPEVLATTSTPAMGGFMSDGNYAYVAVYRWTDNTGRDHRSAPTLTPLTVILSGGGSVQSVVLAVPTLRITEKTNVAIEIYRTENNGTQYYKITNDLSPLLNNPTVDTVAFTDTLSDTTLIAQELIYTTGGVLENIGPGAVHQVCVLNGERIAYLDEEQARVRYSKVLNEGGPVEYSDGIYRDCDPSAGALTAIRAMQEKLIIFSADGCFFTAGEGPLNTGEQDTFTKPEIVSTDVGCTEPDSLILTPNGLMFKSRKGLWMYGPSGMQYTGAPVELYNSQTVTSGCVVGELNQVRFTLSQQRALVYNYNLNRWATFENHGGISAVTIGNEYYYLREDGALYKENRSSFGDASSPIKFKIETGWLTLSELQAFSRVKRALLLGEYKSPHRLRVRVAYDFTEVWVQELILDPADFMSTGAYGDDSPYGTESPYGGNGIPYQPEVNFKRQKCQAIKLSIEDVQEEIGEGLSLSAISLSAAQKVGLGKVGADRKYGTS